MRLFPLISPTDFPITLRLTGRLERLQPSFIYEGNNIRMRYWMGWRRFGILSGSFTAFKWRLLGLQGRKIFVLRDSLFGQQDNLSQHQPFSPMLSLNWILTAISTQNHQPIHLPPPTADLDWTSISSPGDFFGEFQLPSNLFKLANTSLASSRFKSRTRIRSARFGLVELSRQINAVIQHDNQEPEALLSRSAELISSSDRKYFSPTIREKSIIPILVENPNPYEKGLGKGFSSPKAADVSEAVQFKALVQVLKRRLEDGDIALERYDISKDSEISRVVKLLEALIPEGYPGSHKVWIWINGPLDHSVSDRISGTGPLAFLPQFQRILDRSNIHLASLRLLAKPDLTKPMDQAQIHSLHRALSEYAKFKVYNSLNLTSHQVRKLGLFRDR